MPGRVVSCSKLTLPGDVFHALNWVTVTLATRIRTAPRALRRWIFSGTLIQLLPLGKHNQPNWAVARRSCCCCRQTPKSDLHFTTYCRRLLSAPPLLHFHLGLRLGEQQQPWVFSLQYKIEMFSWAIAIVFFYLQNCLCSTQPASQRGSQTVQYSGGKWVCRFSA